MADAVPKYNCRTTAAAHALGLMSRRSTRQCVGNICFHGGWQPAWQRAVITRQRRQRSLPRYRHVRSGHCSIDGGKLRSSACQEPKRGRCHDARSVACACDRQAHPKMHCGRSCWGVCTCSSAQIRVLQTSSGSSCRCRQYAATAADGAGSTPGARPHSPLQCIFRCQAISVPPVSGGLAAADATQHQV